MNKRVLIAAAVFAFGGLAFGQTAKKTFRADHHFSVLPGGALVLENPVGNIEIVGSDGTEIEATTLTTVTASTPAGIDEGHRNTKSLAGGDVRTRILKAALPPIRAGWDATVDWSVKVPRTTHVTVLSQASRRIGVMNISGNVHVKNFSGSIVVHNATGETLVESVNGSIAYSTPVLGANAVLTSVNGHITASLPADATVQWVAETTGQIRTNLPVRGGFDGNIYRGTINGAGGPTITTATLMGNIYLLANGSGMTNTLALNRPQPRQTAAPALVKNEPFKGFLRVYQNVGDVAVPEVEGDVDIYTGAGKVLLGDVKGACKVFSRGGPLEFGDILGDLEASTQAGDITVERARRGGILTTRGGTIRVLYANAPMRLASGGGDIVVRRTTAPVKAETTSGDITIAVDRGSATETIEAKTEKGNVIVRVGVNFSAVIDATIFTTDPEADTIVSDLPGLAITKQQIEGGRTRVHASGKINGGGERLLLEATGGDIRITTAPEPGLPPKRR